MVKSLGLKLHIIVEEDMVKRCDFFRVINKDDLIIVFLAWNDKSD